MCRSCKHTIKLTHRPTRSISEVAKAQYYIEQYLKWLTGHLTLGPGRDRLSLVFSQNHTRHEAAACSIWKEKWGWCCSLTYGV